MLFVTAATAFLLALTTASPTLRNAARQYESSPTCDPSSLVEVTLYGAADAEYYANVPCNGEYTPTNNPLSISHVSVSYGACLFVGIDGTNLCQEQGFADFGPPQTIVSIACGVTC